MAERSKKRSGSDSEHTLQTQHDRFAQDSHPQTPTIPSVESPQLTQPPNHSFSVPTHSNQPGKFRIPESPRSAAGEHAPKSAKVAIPRLRRDSEGYNSTKSGGRHRVTHACEPCRQRKTKCSGDRPVCKHCTDFRIQCYYADGKRDRAKRQFGSMAEKLHGMEALLKDLGNRVGDEDKEAIKKILEEDFQDLSDSAVFTNQAVLDGHEVSSSGGESDVSAGVGSTGALDRIDEDFNRNSSARASGFVGKNSEITWMQRVKEETYPDEDGEPGQDRGTQGGVFSATETNYHLDDLSIAGPGDVDPLEVPVRETADHLFHTYLQTVHPSFPIISRANYSFQYNKFYENPSDPDLVRANKWRAILNLIFAIGAKHSHLVQASWQGDERDQLIYLSRARQLSLNSDTIFSHPDLQQVQIYGLVGFYLLSISQINRAWTFTGMALRAAMALGINMRNNSNQTSHPSKEIRYRVWWSLYGLEQQLSMMTGRPTCISDIMCTAPLPIPYEEESFKTPGASSLMNLDAQKGSRYPYFDIGVSPSPSSETSRSASKAVSSSHPTPTSRSPSNTAQGDLDWAKGASPCLSLYFLYLVQINRITRFLFDQLYAPDRILQSWSNTQKTIDHLDKKLLSWKASLPGVFDFNRKQRDQAFTNQRVSLGLFFYAARMTVSRPCLCRLDRKIPNQSERSNDFNRTTAVNCVEAAMAMIDLFPSEINVVKLFQTTPWWCIIQHIMQAASVLLLEISFRAAHMPDETDNVFESTKTAIRWLYAMAVAEVKAAQRAWKIAHSLLRDVCSKIGRDINDLESRLPEPPPLPPPVYAHSLHPYMYPTVTEPPQQQPTQEEQQQQHAEHQQQHYPQMTTMADFASMPYMFSGPEYTTPYTAFDQYLPFDQTTGELAMFPTNAPMDLMVDGDGYHGQPDEYEETPKAEEDSR